MYWNFGGNFEPVATSCQYSEWTTCLDSFIKYIWFEVVTDVADCLANEAVLWRVLSILLTFMVIAYFVYWKSQWAKEVQRSQEKFVAVNHKIQDLELKVDIITYKTQYGIWPLQYLQEKNNLANLKNFRFGLSNFTLENPWIKNLLARVNEQKYFLEKCPDLQTNISQNYSKTDEPDFSLSDFDNELFRQEQHQATISAEKGDEGNSEDSLQCVDRGRTNSSFILPPESNLSDRSKKHILYIKENVEARNNNSPRRKSLALDKVAFRRKKAASNRELKIVASTTNMTVYSKALLSRFQGKTLNIPNRNSHFLNKSHDTLLDVQERLTALYKTIHDYNKKNSLIPMLKLDSDSNRIGTTNVVSRIVDESTVNNCALEDPNQSSKNIHPQNSGEYSNDLTSIPNELESLVEVESRNNDHPANCNVTEETSNNSSKLSTYNGRNTGDLAKHKNTIDRPMEFQLTAPSNSVNILEGELPPETVQKVTSLDDCTSALLQEALKFKKQILSKVESQDNEIYVEEEEHTLNCSETNSESSLKQSNIVFESKILDMITEESSVSSFTEKKSDFYGYKIVEKNKTSQDKTIPFNEKTKRSLCSKNTSANFETPTDEKVKKQKEVNCPPKVNSKSFTGEPSSGRIFPSSFSTIFLCNDQNNTNHSKQLQDDTILEMKLSQDLISLTQSSSDASVNSLINKLIENERKTKKSSQLVKPERTVENGSTQNRNINSNDVKLSNCPNETDSKINYDSILHQSNSKTVIDENTKCKDTFSIEASRAQCLKQDKTVVKKLIDPELDIKDNKDDNSSEMRTYSDGFSECCSTPKVEYEPPEIKDASEQYVTSNTSKELERTVDSINFNNTQKALTKYNLDYNNWKPSRAKSNLDITAADKGQFKLTHRRSKSYVNPRVITNESEKEYLLESSSSSNKLSSITTFDRKGAFNNQVDIKRNRSSGSLCSKSSSNLIQKSNLLKDRQVTLRKNYCNPVGTNLNKKESTLELIPLVKYSSSKSCIPVMNNRKTPKKDVSDPHLCNSAELSRKLSLQNAAQGIIYQMGTDTDEICSLTISEEKGFAEKFAANFPGLERLKNVEQDGVIYYSLVSEDSLISSDTNQRDQSDVPIEDLIVTDKVVRGKAINATSTIAEAINRPLTCVLSDELSELNSLNSYIFQNSIPPISPYQIERKETEVLVKPSTLDISTSMTNLPCVYHFEEGNTMNDLKIFELSDELTKEECIRYLQMLDQDSNCDQSTNTHDFCNRLLENS